MHDQPKRRGRPATPNPRSATVSFMITESERAELLALSLRTGVPVAQLLRDAALGVARGDVGAGGGIRRTA